MHWVDIAILVVIGASILVGALRGFVREAFSLAVWALAFIVAFQFSGIVADRLAESVSLPSARTALAFGGLFLVTLLVGGLLTYLVGKLVDKTGLSGTDRLLGGLFGAARGLILVIMVILVAGFTPLPADPWWKESRGIQSLMPLAHWSAEWIPENIREHLDFDPAAPESPAKA